MRILPPKSSPFAIRTVLAGVALILLVAGTVHCDKTEQAAKDDKLDQQVQAIKNQYAKVSTCAMCRKEATGKTICRIGIDEAQKVKTCCAGCGVKMLKRLGSQKGGSAMCYSTGQRIDLRKAYFVVGSDARICCSPSVLAFSSREEAEKFVTEHQGEIKRFSDL